jgi:hypothetical protein
MRHLTDASFSAMKPHSTFVRNSKQNVCLWRSKNTRATVEVAPNYPKANVVCALSNIECGRSFLLSGTTYPGILEL